MSGGSLNYLADKLGQSGWPDGLDDFLRFAERIDETMAVVADAIPALRVRRVNEPTEPYFVERTEHERGVAQAAVTAARARLAECATTLRTIRAELAGDLGQVIHDIEWWMSGDTGKEEIADSSVLWFFSPKRPG